MKNTDSKIDYNEKLKEFIGKTGICKKCGNKMTPFVKDDFSYGCFCEKCGSRIINN